MSVCFFYIASQGEKQKPTKGGVIISIVIQTMIIQKIHVNLIALFKLKDNCIRYAFMWTITYFKRAHNMLTIMKQMNTKRHIFSFLKQSISEVVDSFDWGCEET